MALGRLRLVIRLLRRRRAVKQAVRVTEDNTLVLAALAETIREQTEFAEMAAAFALSDLLRGLLGDQ